MMYAELAGNRKKQRIKSLCGNKFVYVEFGSGAKGDPSVAHTTKGSWVYCKNGRFYTTSGQPARPFLVPALTNNVDAIIAQFKAALGGG